MHTYDLVIRNAQIHTMDDESRVMDRGTLAIRGDRIAWLGQGDLPEGARAAREIDADGMILFPGFVDTHIHIFQSFLKGLGADHRLIEWLNLSALPYGRIMTPRQHRLAAQLACMEALKSGCTTLCEFFYTRIPSWPMPASRACAPRGYAASLSEPSRIPARNTACRPYSSSRRTGPCARWRR